MLYYIEPIALFDYALLDKILNFSIFKAIFSFFSTKIFKKKQIFF